MHNGKPRVPEGWQAKAMPNDGKYWDSPTGHIIHLICMMTVGWNPDIPGFTLSIGKTKRIEKE
ncbi:hypothetical protein D3C71_1087400 [compost metagenome]